MKKLILSLLPFSILLFSCGPELDLDLSGLNIMGGPPMYGPSTPTPTGVTGIFFITENGSKIGVEGDAYSPVIGTYAGPGSVMHREIASSAPDVYYYKLECLGYSTDAYALYLNFDLLTTAQGQPLDSLTTGTFNGSNSVYRNAGIHYQAFHNDDPELNQQLSSVLTITRIINGRMDGTFTGKYVETNPETGEVLSDVVTITGEFKNIIVHD